MRNQYNFLNLDRRYIKRLRFNRNFKFTGYPKPLYKKHSSYKQALAYFNKFNKGVEDSADDSGDEVKKPENKKAEKRGRNAEKDSVPSKKSKSK